MLTIDAKALLAPPRPFTDDELTDLIAAVVDDLDARVIDPSVSTTRSDSGVVVEVSMTIDTNDPWTAQAAALAAMRGAFDAAVPAVAGIARGLALIMAGPALAPPPTPDRPDYPGDDPALGLDPELVSEAKNLFPADPLLQWLWCVPGPRKQKLEAVEAIRELRRAGEGNPGQSSQAG